jgi:hypothetical protein
MMDHIGAVRGFGRKPDGFADFRIGAYRLVSLVFQMNPPFLSAADGCRDATPTTRYRTRRSAT